MKNVFKVLGVIALVAIIGFSFVSCGDSGGGGEKFQGQSIKSGEPSTATLNKYGLTKADLDGTFNAARAAMDDPDYQGYVDFTEEGVSFLYLIWFNKTNAKYNAVVNQLEDKFGETMFLDTLLAMAGTEFPSDVRIAGGLRESSSSMDIWIVEFFSSRYEDIPQGTLAVGFMKVSY